MTQETEIDRLPNLGPVSVGLLREAGIESVEQLRDLGAVFVYAEIKRRNAGVTLNLLWSLAAGLENRRWTELSQKEKLALTRELDSFLR